MTNQIMLDLETFSTASDAAIVAIGAVRFDIKNLIVHKTDNFYCTITAKSSQKAGGRIDGDTVTWWLQQSESARKELTGDTNILIDAALNNFSNWVRQKPCDGMWGNGSDYDNVVLGNAYLRSNKTQPWPYRINRCYRTIKSFAPDLPVVREGTFHNALHDAITQATHLCKIIEKMKNGFSNIPI
jgi:hypothetical protein